MSRRLSSLRDIGTATVRNIDSSYDNIKLIADNLDAVLNFLGGEIPVVDLYPNSWFNGFNSPITFDGIIYFNEDIG